MSAYVLQVGDICSIAKYAVLHDITDLSTSSALSLAQSLLDMNTQAVNERYNERASTPVLDASQVADAPTLSEANTYALCRKLLSQCSHAQDISRLAAFKDLQIIMLEATSPRTAGVHDGETCIGIRLDGLKPCLDDLVVVGPGGVKDSVCAIGWDGDSLQWRFTEVLIEGVVPNRLLLPLSGEQVGQLISKVEQSAGQVSQSEPSHVEVDLNAIVLGF